MAPKEDSFGKFKEAIVEIATNWGNKYQQKYEENIKKIGEKSREGRVYDLEKEAVGDQYVATSWISQILKEEFGKGYIDANITRAIEQLKKEGIIEDKITQPLSKDKYKPGFDEPIAKIFNAPRRGIKIKPRFPQSTGLEDKIAVFLSLLIGGFGVGIIFSEAGATGNIIGNSGTSLLGIGGIIFVIIGLIGAYFYFKKK